MKNLTDLLQDYGSSDFYGFHMPGHKRNQELLGKELPYNIDITEIEEFDDLHHASGILLEAEKRAARIYGAKKSYFLVNGSTSGNLSAIMACTKRRGKILVARNNHRSVYNGIYLQELTPVYLYPEFDQEKQLNGEINVQDVKRALDEDSEIQAVMIVSPTYDGVVSDVEAIAREAHAHHIPLIVDEAHGAHFGFHPYFSKNSNQLGADIVIHSVHKTMPSLTQTALLHVNGDLVDSGKVRLYLSMLQSSSPSYVLMGSIDQCMQLVEERGNELFENYKNLIMKTRESLSQMRNLELLETEHYDRSKLLISTRNSSITSQDLYRTLLRDYHLQMEMVSGTYILAMTSIADTKEGFQRLVSALLEIDQSIEQLSPKERMRAAAINQRLGNAFPRLERVYTSYEMAQQWDKIKKNMGKTYVATQYSYLYPPGIPIVVPGEIVSQEALDIQASYEEAGFTIEHT